MNETEIKMKKTSIFNLQLEFMVRKAFALCMNFAPSKGGYTLLNAPKESETNKKNK